MRTKTVSLLPAFLLCLGLSEGRAAAGCTISVTGVAFGTYDAFARAPLDSTGTVVFECDKPDKRIRITLSPGSSSTYTRRTMTSGQEILSYNLYLDSFQSVWGDGTGGSTYYSNNNPPNNRVVTLTIYGRIAPQQDVAPGHYTDTVRVQIDF